MAFAAADTGAIARLRAAWRGWRNRRIADPAFQSFAARFPLSRPFARREAEELYDIVTGFVYSQTLFACVELGLLAEVERGALTAASLGDRLNLPHDAAERLAQAAAALRLLEREGESYALGPVGAAVLGAPGVEAMIRHHRLFYRDLADPVALLRGAGETELHRFWSYCGNPDARGLDDAATAPYSRLMAASQAMVAEETLAAVSLSGVRRLLDVGGGEGVFLAAAARAEPRLRVTLFDLPSVAARARASFRAQGLDARADAVGGSFRDDPLPRGCDAISLVRVLYDHDDATVARLLGAVRDALARDGRVIVSEPMSGGVKPTRSGDAYFGLYTLAMRSGRPRSYERHTELLAAAGFTGIVRHATRQRFVTSVITARRG